MAKQRVAIAGLGLSALWFVLHVSGVGGLDFQVTGYRLFAPVLSAIPAYLTWQAARRAPDRQARGCWRWAAAGWVSMVFASLWATAELLFTGNLDYPTSSPVVQIADLVTLGCTLIAMLRFPVRTRWAGSRLRLGLDMLAVLLSGLVFLWHFVVGPGVEAHGGGLSSDLIFVQTAGALVVLFAVARLVLAGAASVTRGALFAFGGAGAAVVLIGVLQSALRTGAHLHFALAAWALFTGLITLGPALHLRAAAPARQAPALGRKPSSLLPYASIAAVFALVVGVLHDRGLDRGAWSVLIGAVALTALVVVRQIVAMRENGLLLVRLDDSLGALREAMARERVLGDLGTALLRATEVAGVHQLAVRAATELLAEVPGARTTLLTADHEDPDTVSVVTAAGAGADAVLGTRLPAADIPAELLVRLAAGETVAGRCLADLGVTGVAAEDRPLILLPLVNGERFFGVLSVSADGVLPDGVLTALHGLRTQVSLALASVALTEELTMQAMHDPLTGLGNRALLRERLTGALARARRTGRPVGALLLDLNGFKPVNDAYGHDAGDALLKIVADRLRQSVRTEDTISRLGGDEFVVIAEDLRSARDAVVIAERIVDALNETVPVSGQLLKTPASIGIALSHVDTLGPDDLLRAAGTAMHDAKRSGEGRYRLHGAPAALV